MKREELVAKYLEDYLEGKDDGYRESFTSKPIDRQYSAIQTWRRRRLEKFSKESVSVLDIIDSVKCAAAQVNSLESISPKEMEKLNRAIENLQQTVDNFDEIVRQRRLRQLQEMRDKLDREISELEGQC